MKPDQFLALEEVDDDFNVKPKHRGGPLTLAFFTMEKKTENRRRVALVVDPRFPDELLTYLPE